MKVRGDGAIRETEVADQKSRHDVDTHRERARAWIDWTFGR